MMQAAGAGALAARAPRTQAALATNWPILEGPQTPKIGLGVGVGRMNEATARKLKQLGVHYVLGGGPRIPWQLDELKSMMDNCRNLGLTLGNLMIGGFNNTIYGRAGRDEEIEKVIQSIRVAGKVGLAVVEYNFYAHRAMEGYYAEEGRAGAGYTAFDYDRMKDLPA
ncbi:MAG TPA: mannonate dehydratase, partial [Bryobacteraceae bacterium]